MNPQLKFHNSRRGYLLCDVMRDRWTTEYVVMDQVSTRGGVASTRTKMVVESGSAKVAQG